MCANYNIVNDFGGGIGRFCRNAGNKVKIAAKKPNSGATKMKVAEPN